MGERLDPEALRRVLSRYYDTARDVVERHGGVVEKFVGDAVMAVFGVPVLHEDDALRAVRAAAALRERTGRLNDELEREFGTRLTLRMGVNTGEVITGTEERLAVGDAVNVAARLEQSAGPDEILLGSETFTLVRTAVIADPGCAAGREGQERTAIGVAARERPPRKPPWPPLRRADGRSRAGAPSARRQLRARPARAPLRAGHDPRPRGRRQVTAGARVPGVARLAGRGSRPLHPVRRWNHLPAGHRDRATARVPVRGVRARPEGGRHTPEPARCWRQQPLDRTDLVRSSQAARSGRPRTATRVRLRRHPVGRARPPRAHRAAGGSVARCAAASLLHRTIGSEGAAPGLGRGAQRGDDHRARTLVRRRDGRADRATSLQTTRSAKT